MSEKTLDEEIESAFPHAMPPKGRLVKGVQIEAQQVQEFFAGRAWWEITLEALQKEYLGDGSACLWFMLPHAVAYYLPAYIRIAAMAYVEADAISAEFVIKLRRVAEGNGGDFADALELLNDRQNAVIASVLERIAGEYETVGRIEDASVALALRWGQYLASD